MPAPPLVSRPALVIGCGYLGLRVAKAWLASGRRVYALTRGRSAELATAGIEPIVGDVCDPDSLRSFPTVSTVLYAVGLDRRAGRPMREVYVDGLANVVAAFSRDAQRSAEPPPRFLYVSSTSVYGQTGSLVTESSPTEPLEESGKIILEAEVVLRRAIPDAIVLRFAGIYGPDRVIRRQALLAGEPLVGDADKWLNLIHVEDGVRAVRAAEERGRPGATYLVADGTPVRRRDFYTHAAEVLGAPPARFEHRATEGEANRRIEAGRIRSECGFVPQYPSYREGLAQSVGSHR